MGEQLIAMPVPIRGKVLIRGAEHLFCVGPAATGETQRRLVERTIAFSLCLASFWFPLRLAFLWLMSASRLLGAAFCRRLDAAFAFRCPGPGQQAEVELAGVDVDAPPPRRGPGRPGGSELPRAVAVR